MSTAAFLSQLDTHQREDGRLVLDKPLRYRTAKGVTGVTGGRIFEVPVGFDTDLASVPWGLRNLAARWSRSARAGVLHDWLYRSGATARSPADDLFYEALRVEGVDPITSWVMWLGVRIGGGSSYRGGWIGDREKPA